jgi:hypothetical protein
MVFISLLTGGVMLLIFRLTSNQQAMKEVKTKISAYFLEMRLYKEDISTVVGSQGRVLRANMAYMKLALVPAVIMIVPVVLIMVQLNLRYDRSPLSVGETAIVKVRVAEGADVMREGLRLSTGGGVDKMSPAVRIAELNEADWKIKLTKAGVHTLTVSSSRGEVEIPVFGTDRLVPIFRIFKKGSLYEAIFNPGATRIPEPLPIESIEIDYPVMAFGWGLFELNWLFTFLLISMAFGVVLKLVLKVE